MEDGAERHRTVHGRVYHHHCRFVPRRAWVAQASAMHSPQHQKGAEAVRQAVPIIGLWGRLAFANLPPREVQDGRKISPNVVDVTLH
ncbi:hypothetical protein ACIPCF_01550 [Paracoccus marcusii]|uniref:hypothetical protein n=1 Tax=Paracoccus marcusii TaxID=59779 RepID=UPI0038BAA3D4